MSKKLSYHLLPISLAAQVLEWHGLWPGSQVTQDESDYDDVSDVPVIVLNVVADILCVGPLSPLSVLAIGCYVRVWVPCWLLTSVFYTGFPRSRDRSVIERSRPCSSRCALRALVASPL